MSLAPISMYPIHHTAPYPCVIDAGAPLHETVQYYVTFDGKPYNPPPMKPAIEGGKIYYSKSSSPPTENLAAPDLMSMTEVWQKEFNVIFGSFMPQRWSLYKTFQSPSPRWRRFKDSAKVRFCCQTCGHAWTSMKGRIMFWFHITTDQAYPEGFLQYKLYGQQCKQCQNGFFEDAMWYPEEVNKVLCNVYNKIGQTYYGFVLSPIRQDRRAGRPRTQHNSALCQACMDGECFKSTKIEDKSAPVQSTTTYVPTASVPSHSQRIVVPVHPPIMQHKSTSMSALAY